MEQVHCSPTCLSLSDVFIPLHLASSVLFGHHIVYEVSHQHLQPSVAWDPENLCSTTLATPDPEPVGSPAEPAYAPSVCACCLLDISPMAILCLM